MGQNKTLMLSNIRGGITITFSADNGNEGTQLKKVFICPKKQSNSELFLRPSHAA